MNTNDVAEGNNQVFHENMDKEHGAPTAIATDIIYGNAMC